MVTAEKMRQRKEEKLIRTFYERFSELSADIRRSSLEGKLEDEVELAKDRTFSAEERERITSLYTELKDYISGSEEYLEMLGAINGDNGDRYLRIKKAAIDVALCIYDLSDQSLERLKSKYFS